MMLDKTLIKAFLGIGLRGYAPHVGPTCGGLAHWTKGTLIININIMMTMIMITRVASKIIKYTTIHIYIYIMYIHVNVHRTK